MLIAEHGILHVPGESEACPQCREKRPVLNFYEPRDAGTLIIMVLVLLASLWVGAACLPEVLHSQHYGPAELEGGYGKPPGFANHEVSAAPGFRRLNPRTRERGFASYDYKFSSRFPGLNRLIAF
jgi:hypothetical protein